MASSSSNKKVDPASRIPFEITKMTLADLPEVMAIERASYQSPWPEMAYRQQLANEQASFDLLRYQGHLLGYSGVWLLEDVIHIGTIVSHPLVRGQGVGALLLVKIIERGIGLAFESVTLEVRPSNKTAQQLYLRYGLQEVGRRVKYYPDTGEDAIVMTTPSLHSETYQARFAQLKKGLLERLRCFRLDESVLSS